MEAGLHIVRNAKVFVFLQAKLALLICSIEDRVDFAKKIIASIQMEFIKTLKANGVAHAIYADANKHIQDTITLGKARLLNGDVENVLLKRKDFLQTRPLGKSKGYTISSGSRPTLEGLSGILHLKNLCHLTMDFAL